MKYNSYDTYQEEHERRKMQIEEIIRHREEITRKLDEIERNRNYSGEKEYIKINEAKNSKFSLNNDYDDLTSNKKVLSDYKTAFSNDYNLNSYSKFEQGYKEFIASKYNDNDNSSKPKALVVKHKSAEKINQKTKIQIQPKKEFLVIKPNESRYKIINSSSADKQRKVISKSTIFKSANDKSINKINNKSTGNLNKIDSTSKKSKNNNFFKAMDENKNGVLIKYTEKPQKSIHANENRNKVYNEEHKSRFEVINKQKSEPNIRFKQETKLENLYQKYRVNRFDLKRKDSVEEMKSDPNVSSRHSNLKDINTQSKYASENLPVTIYSKDEDKNVKLYSLDDDDNYTNEIKSITGGLDQLNHQMQLKLKHNEEFYEHQYIKAKESIIQLNDELEQNHKEVKSDKKVNLDDSTQYYDKKYIELKNKLQGLTKEIDTNIYEIKENSRNQSSIKDDDNDDKKYKVEIENDISTNDVKINDKDYKDLNRNLLKYSYKFDHIPSKVIPNAKEKYNINEIEPEYESNKKYEYQNSDVKSEFKQIIENIPKYKSNKFNYQNIIRDEPEKPVEKVPKGLVLEFDMRENQYSEQPNQKLVERLQSGQKYLCSTQEAKKRSKELTKKFAISPTKAAKPVTRERMFKYDNEMRKNFSSADQK